jgi:glycosyltransferase involved in cell wall biosynthesis
VATLRHQGRHFAALRREGVETSFVGLRSRADLVGIARAYRLWRLQPDVVVTSSVDAQMIGHLVATRARAPHVTLEHGGPGLPRALHRRLLVRAVAPRVACAVAVSRTQVGELVRLGFRGERIAVIPNGIPEPAPQRAREAVRAELGVGCDDVLVLLVATLRPEKRAGLFVEVVRRAHAQEPRLRGAVAGGGPQLAHVRSLAAASGGIVSVLGERDDVADLMAAADVVCLTSAVEGLPVTALEAMALSRPLLASRVGGLADAVADGSTGMLVAPEDVAGFADALVALAKAPERRRAMGEAARRAYLERYTLSSMLDRYVDLLAPLAEPSAKRQPLQVPAAGE